MPTITHPFSRSVYEPHEEPGTVRVTAPGGASGLFSKTGVWLTGDKIDVDPHMCLWVGQPRRMHNRVKQT